MHLINDKNFYQWLKNNFQKLLINEKKQVYHVCNFKKYKNQSKICKLMMKKKILLLHLLEHMLNFGHTFGHALETINKYQTNLTHGEAISIGMVLAAKISYKLKNIRKE